MEDKKIIVSVSTGTVLKILGILLAVLFIWVIRDILLVVFIAIIFAALIEPSVDVLEKKKLPRGISVLLLYVIILLFLVLVVRLLVPPISQQVSNVTANLPQLWDQISENFQSVQDISGEETYLANIQQSLQTLQRGLTSAAGSVYGFIVSVFKNVVNFFLILIITFYLVVQRNSLNTVLKAAAPSKYNTYLDDLASRIQQKIGAWARGQLILGLIIGVISFVGLIFILPDYALVLALVAGLTELIPYIGPIIGAIPALFLGFTVSFGHGIAVLVLYIIIQQIENNVIVPQVMRKQLGMNPIVIIIAMLIGARLAGIIGLILAVPVATSLHVILKDFLHKSEIKKLKDEPQDAATHSQDL